MKKTTLLLITLFMSAGAANIFAEDNALKTPDFPALQQNFGQKKTDIERTEYYVQTLASCAITDSGRTYDWNSDRAVLAKISGQYFENHAGGLPDFADKIKLQQMKNEVRDILSQTAREENNNFIESLGKSVGSTALAGEYVKALRDFVSERYGINISEWKLMDNARFRSEAVRNRAAVDSYFSPKPEKLIEGIYHKENTVVNGVLAAYGIGGDCYVSLSKIDGDYYMHLFNGKDANFSGDRFIVSNNLGDFFNAKAFKKRLRSSGLEK